MSRHHRIGKPSLIALLLAVAMVGLLALWLQNSRSVLAQDVSTKPLVLEVAIDGAVEPILAQQIDTAITEAAQRKAALVLITMDTPGGLSDSMKDIIQHILQSPVPVAVFVSPQGARGASAGFFILLSADVAAMATATHAGASTPILIGGGLSMPIDEVLRRKLNNDAMAFLRSFAEKRGRNPKLAETSVTDARAFTEQEALDAHLIDIVANDKHDLLKKLNGREITRFDGTKTTLNLLGYDLQKYELTGRQKFLAWLADPNVLFVLLIIGVLGLYTEFTHPGVVAPGVFGAICIVLALYSMQLLPVNYVGVLLIALAFALFVLEAKFASHGVLMIGGVVSMLLGAMFLIHSPLTPGGVSIGVALGATLPFAFITVFLMRLVMKSRGWKSATGKEELLGEEGVVTAAVPADGEGMIRIHGELWRAVSEQGIAVGETVRVRKMDGLTLVVEPATKGLQS